MVEGGGARGEGGVQTLGSDMLKAAARECGADLCGIAS